MLFRSEGDFVIPNAYEYRDYVVRALNSDLPYDDFVREHLAGDLLPQPRLDPTTGSNESILATGWAFLGEEIHAPVDTRADETERIDNRIDVFSKAFLGLTVACARCHDHKYDPLLQADFFRLRACFEGIERRDADIDPAPAAARGRRENGRLGIDPEQPGNGGPGALGQRPEGGRDAAIHRDPDDVHVRPAGEGVAVRQVRGAEADERHAMAVLGERGGPRVRLGEPGLLAGVERGEAIAVDGRHGREGTPDAAATRG